MSTGRFAVEHAGKLAVEPLTHDAVGVQHCGVRGETRPDGGNGVVARPIDKVAQCVPIRLVFQSAAMGSVPVTIRPSSGAFHSSEISR
jgi:hypothetical protein